MPDSDALWYKDGMPIYPDACQFVSDFTNANLYHYCSWNGDGILPTSVGCGVAVDTRGVTWRVVKVGP